MLMKWLKFRSFFSSLYSIAMDLEWFYCLSNRKQQTLKYHTHKILASMCYQNNRKANFKQKWNRWRWWEQIIAIIVPVPEFANRVHNRWIFWLQHQFKTFDRLPGTRSSKFPEPRFSPLTVPTAEASVFTQQQCLSMPVPTKRLSGSKSTWAHFCPSLLGLHGTIQHSWTELPHLWKIHFANEERWKCHLLFWKGHHDTTAHTLC